MRRVNRECGEEDRNLGNFGEVTNADPFLLMRGDFTIAVEI